MRPHANRELIVPLYFHLGGLGAGAFALGTLLTVLKGEGSAALARGAFLVAPPLLWVCGGLLTAHLTRPGRFWRVLTRFKWRSPISVGAWGLTVLAGVSTLVAGLMLLGRGPTTADPLMAALLLVGGGAAWFVCAYTGVLLVASSRRLWNSSNLPGGLFCVTGLATAACLLRLLVPALPAEPAAVAKLERIGTCLLLLAGGLWVQLDRALFRVFREDGRPVGLALRRNPYGYSFWGGLALGFVAPALLLGQGGVVALAGALLGVTASVGPRAAFFLAGEPGD